MYLHYDKLMVAHEYNQFYSLEICTQMSNGAECSIVEALSGDAYLDQLEATTVCCCSFVHSSESILLCVSAFKCVCMSVSVNFMSIYCMCEHV